MTTYLLSVLAIIALFIGFRDLTPKIYEMIESAFDDVFEDGHRDKFVAK